MKIKIKNSVDLNQNHFFYRECFMMLMKCVAVQDGINGNHLISPPVNVFQPKQQTMAHLMKFLPRNVFIITSSSNTLK